MDLAAVGAMAPGTSVARFRMLRLESGRLVTDSCVMVLATVFCVVSNTGATPATSMLSVIDPTLSCTARSVVREDWTATFRNVADWNPWAETVTS